jgi:hypothetical protein
VTTQQDRESWTTAERYIAGRLDRIDAQLTDQGNKIYQINGEVSGLRTRASIYGGVFGVLTGIITALLSAMGIGKG